MLNKILVVWETNIYVALRVSGTSHIIEYPNDGGAMSVFYIRWSNLKWLKFGPLILALMVFPGIAQEPSDDRSAKSANFTYQLLRAARVAEGGDNLAAAQIMTKAVSDTVVPEIWSDSPNWLKRVEFD